MKKTSQKKPKKNPAKKLSVRVIPVAIPADDKARVYRSWAASFVPAKEKEAK